MKYIWAALAVLAAVAALIILPPHRVTSAIAPGKSGLPDIRSSDVPERTPHVTPGPVRQRRVVVYVAGQVQKPGVYALPAGTRGADALARAGGPLPNADLVAVNLAAPLADGDEIAVPKIGTPSSTRQRGVHSGMSHRLHAKASRPRRIPQRLAPPQQAIDLNAAAESDLEGVPGIGPGLAARIVAYREANGPFSSIDELADVSGITPRLQDTLAQFVFVR